MKKWTKLFSLAIGALMAIGAAVGVKQTVERVNAEDNKITTLAGITSGNKYYIGATTSGTDYYFYADGSSTTVSIAGTAKTNKNEAAALTFTQVTNGWNIQFASGNYLGLKNGKDNGKVQVLSTAATFTIEEVTDKGLLKLSNNSYCVQKNNSGAQFGSYGNTQTNVWLMEYVEAGETVNVDGVTLNLNTKTIEKGETFELIETVSPNNATNKGVTWSTDNSSIATVSNGTVTGVSEGSTTITVTTEDGNFSASCNVTVTASTVQEKYAEADFGVGRFLITASKDDVDYYLPTKATTSSPSAISFTNVNSINSTNLWFISKATDSDLYEIKNSGGDYLYVIDNNNGARVGSTTDSWAYIKSGDKSSLKSTNNNRYIGVYDTTEWRTYTTSNQTNYSGSGENLKFYKFLKDKNITYVLGDGGTNDNRNPAIYEEGVGVSELYSPTRPGYDFGGWKLNDSIVDSISTDVTGDIELIAVWNAKVLDFVTSSQLNIKYSYNEEELDKIISIESGHSYVMALPSGKYVTDLSSEHLQYSTDEKDACLIKLDLIAGQTNVFSMKINDSYIGYNSSTKLKIDKTVSNDNFKWTIEGTNGDYTIQNVGVTDRFLSDGGSDIRPYSNPAADNLFNFYKKTDLSISSIREYGLRFSCEFNAATIASKFTNPGNWQCGFMVAQTTQMKTTFEKSYENLKKVSDNQIAIADVAAGAMETGNAEVSMYKEEKTIKTMAQLPAEVDGMYEFSVNVTIPEEHLEDKVTAVWFAYNTDNGEMVFASEKVMSIEQICGIYDDMKLNGHQGAAIEYIIAQNKWVYAED